MRRYVLFLLCCAIPLAAQDQPRKLETRPPDSQKQGTQPSTDQAPPEEDEEVAPKQYTFNPLQAARDIRIGNYYFKKGNYRAAAKRFEEATKWNAANSEAYLRLGDSREKLSDEPGARKAYAKYLELAPDAKNAGAIRKKIERKP